MSQTRKAIPTKSRYHPAAFEFVDLALRYTQKKLGKRGEVRDEPPPDDAHISGPQLLDGIREVALKEYGLMTMTVLRNWGVTTTDDFGRIVWDMIENGHMRRTDRDQLSDFFAVYDFEKAFDQDYQIDTATAFRR